VLDSPVVNAFAVPGGSVYVTRGILAMMSSKAELAAVLGHELGHVSARHSVHRMSQQMLAQIGLIAGSVISQKFAKCAGLAGAVDDALSYLKKGDWVYVFSAMSAAASFSRYETAFRGVVSSFRELTDASKINRAPQRLAMVKANGSDTLQAIFKKAGMPDKDKSWAQFAVMNGLEITAVPPAGKLIKIAK